MKKLCATLIFIAFSCLSCHGERPSKHEESSVELGPYEAFDPKFDYTGTGTRIFTDMAGRYNFGISLSELLDPDYSGKRVEEMNCYGFDWEGKSVFATFDKRGYGGKITGIEIKDKVHLTRSYCEELGIIGKPASLYVHYFFYYFDDFVSFNCRRTEKIFELDKTFMMSLGTRDSAICYPCNNWYDYPGRTWETQDCLGGSSAYSIYEDDLSEVCGVFTFDTQGRAVSLMKGESGDQRISIYEFNIKMLNGIKPEKSEFYFTPDEFRPGWRHLLSNREFYPEQKNVFTVNGVTYYP